jgi:hypothetical protein
MTSSASNIRGRLDKNFRERHYELVEEFKVFSDKSAAYQSKL